MITDFIDENDRRETARAVRSIPKPNSKLSTIDKIRFVVEHRQANRVNGLYIDMTTANVIIQVYNALNPTNQALFATFSVRKMTTIAWKLASPKI